MWVKHHVTEDEAKEVIRNHHFVRYGNERRIIILGQTDEGRVLDVVFEAKGKGKY
ncbi:MAG: hypothetical protein GY941_08795 [Planctomycetes bacterium]|nr:hypothetical protein [Planctomycetota bacterium]